MECLTTIFRKNQRAEGATAHSFTSKRGMTVSAFLLLLLLLSACNPHAIPVRKDISRNQISLELVIDHTVDSVIARELSREFNDFIFRHNAGNHLFNVSNVAEDIDVRINLVHAQLVTPGQQFAGFLVTVAGIAVPVLMVQAGSTFYFTFWYAPQAHAYLEVAFNPALVDYEGPPLRHVISSPGFLKSRPGQIISQRKYFGRYLANLMQQMEKSMKANQRNRN